MEQMLCVLVGRKLSEVTSNYISNNFKYVEIYTRINLTNDTSIFVLSIYPAISIQPFPRERGHKTREILKNYESSVSMHAKQPNEKRESDYTSE